MYCTKRKSRWESLSQKVEGSCHACTDSVCIWAFHLNLVEQVHRNPSVGLAHAMCASGVHVPVRSTHILDPTTTCLCLLDLCLANTAFSKPWMDCLDALEPDLCVEETTLLYGQTPLLMHHYLGRPTSADVHCYHGSPLRGRGRRWPRLGGVVVPRRERCEPAL